MESATACRISAASARWIACLGISVERIGPRPVSSQSALTLSAEHSPPMNSMLGVWPVM